MDTATRIERAVALGLAIAGMLALLPLAQVFIEVGRMRPTLGLRGSMNFYLMFLSFILALALAAWIAWRGPRDRSATALALALALGAATWVLSMLITVLWVLNEYSEERMFVLTVISLPVGVYLSTWALARFLANFPAPLSAQRLTSAGVEERVARRGTRLVRLSTGPGAAICGTLLLVAVPLAMRDAETKDANGLLLIVLVLPLLQLGIGLLAVERQRRSTDSEGRRRLRWTWVGVMGGFVLFATLGLIAAVADGLANLMFWLTSAFLVAACFCCVCFAVAVLARGDLSPDLVLRRTLVYSAAGLLVTIGFVALLNLLQEHVLGWLGVPPGAAVYLAGGALAVAFGPLQRRLDAWLATRLPGA